MIFFSDWLQWIHWHDEYHLLQEMKNQSEQDKDKMINETAMIKGDSTDEYCDIIIYWVYIHLLSTFLRIKTENRNFN